MEQASAYVYFAQPGDELAVKIGIPMELDQRLACIQTDITRKFACSA